LEKKKQWELEMKTGCQELQTKTYQVISEALNRAVSDAKRGYPRAEAYWRLNRVQAGVSDAFGWHHAVRVTSTLSDNKADFVFDPWYAQSPQVFEYRLWALKSFSFKTATE